MIALYWEIGRQITERQKALGWGKSVVENLSKDIQKEFPGIQGFGVSNLRDMARFYTEYQSNEILQPLVGEISWTKHILILTKCKDTQERRFYILVTKLRPSNEGLAWCYPLKSALRAASLIRGYTHMAQCGKQGRAFRITESLIFNTRGHTAAW